MTTPDLTRAVIGFSEGATASRLRRRAVVATSLGNALEVYDFTVYSFFSAIIGKLFFPTASPTLSLLLSLATFGAGFIARPLGAVVLGRHADRHGRKAALAFTIVLMSIGTALMGLTPTYVQIGVAAPVLLVAGRLMQGLSAGGEIGVASTFLLESAAEDRRCFYVSWQGASQGAAALGGALIATIVVATLSSADLERFGWRIPFLLGLLIGPVGWVIRRQLDETLPTGIRPPRASQLVSVHGRTVVLGTMMMMATTASMYIVIFYMPTYMVTVLHMTRLSAFVATSAAGATLFILSPLFGLLGDRLKNRKTLPVISALIGIALVIPTFNALTHARGLPFVVALVVAMVTCMAMSGGAGGALMLEGLPRAFRATGMAVMYSVGVTVFGGFAQFIVTWLIAVTGSPIAPAWYVLVSTILSLVAVLLYPARVPDA